MTDPSELAGNLLIAVAEKAARKAVGALPLPLDGKDGVGIDEARMIGADLVLLMSDGKSANVGRIKGDRGEPGVSVQSAEVVDGRLLLTMTTGKTLDVGSVKARDGKDGRPGVSVAQAEVDAVGNLVLGMSDGSTVNAGQVKAEQPRDGKDGVGIATAEIDDEGHLILVLTNGRKLDLGRVKGRDGGTLITPGGGNSSSGGSGSASVGGTVDLDFGAAPGGSYIEEVVSAPSITATSRVRAWVAGTTADHNATEHAVIARYMGLSVVPSTGQFTIYAVTDLQLTGQVALTWEAA
jgi:hypothetical protein